MPRRQNLLSNRKSTELAARLSLGVQLEPGALPHAHRRLHQEVHHVDAVVRRRSDTKKLLAAGHCRVVDRLKVDTVLRHQFVGQPHHKLRVTDLRQTYKVAPKKYATTNLKKIVLKMANEIGFLRKVKV